MTPSAPTRLSIGIALLAALGLAAAPGPSAAHGTGPAQAAGAAAREAAVQRLTAALLRQAARHRHAPGDHAAEAALAQLAIERRRALESLLEASPELALRQATLAARRGNLPRAIRPHVEEAVEVEGRVEVFHEDGIGWGRYVYRLEHRLGRSALYLTGRPPGWQSGERVRVRGVQIGGALAADASAAESLGSAPLPRTLGAQRILVLLVNFADRGEQPYGVEEAHRLVFDSASAFLLESSYGRTWLEGTVHGWFTLPIPATCDIDPIAIHAEQAAAVTGVDVASYPRRLYLFPNLGCDWGGRGSIGGSPSQAWIQVSRSVTGRAASDIYTVAHEIGHNLGLYHSHGLECGQVVIGAVCQAVEYGDTLDTMGSRFAHYNAAQKDRLGWLDAPGVATRLDVVASGTYFLEPYEPAGGLKALRLPRPSGGALYVEYRQPLGVDGTLAGSQGVRGVAVHVASGPDDIYLLDMTPMSDSWLDPALAAGAAFADSGVTIAPLWTGPEGAVIAVDLAPAVAITSGPTGLPNPAPPGAAVSLGVVAEDSGGPGVSHEWAVSCPRLAGAGSLSDAHAPRPTWTAPPNDTGARQVCLIEVTVRGGQGLQARASYRQIVRSAGTLVAFADDMESGPGRWVAEAPWALTAASAHSGTRAWTDSPGGNYADGRSVNLYTPVFDLSAATDATLTFWHRHDLAAADHANVWACDAERGCAMVASFAGALAAWTQATVDLGTLAGRSEAWLAFDLRSDSLGTRDGWYLDDVRVVGVPVAPGGPSLVAAVLPGSRSARVGSPVTAFVTVINAGADPAVDVGVELLSDLPATLQFWTTDPLTNDVTGGADVGATIDPGRAQTFVVAVTPWLPFPATDAVLGFSGFDTVPVLAVVGVNSLLISASAGPVSDVVALAVTPSGDGIVHAARPPAVAAFSVAAVNVGEADTVTVSADTGGSALPVALTLCRTNRDTGACRAPAAPSVSLPIGPGETAALAVFLEIYGPVAFDPAGHRVFVTFRDASGEVRGKTSVAVRADAL